MTVTPESNLALIQQLQDLVSSAAEPPSGPEFSYPVVDQAVSSSMWRWITRGMGAGILGEGGQPYWYRNVSNANNTAEISVSTISGEAHAMIGGFYHHLSQAVTVPLPMPSSGTVTYHVALTYDPRRESDPEGPIKLETHTGSLPTTFSREHIPLWSITRGANQLLTDATVRQYRPFVSPTTTYNYRDHLPDPGMMLSGTMARTRLDDGLYMSLQGNEVGPDGTTATARWVNVGEPQWFMFNGDGNGTYFNYPGHGARMAWARHDGIVYIQGRLKRANGQNFLASSDGYLILTLPEAYRPSSERRFTTAAAGFANPVTANIRILSGGEVYVHVGRNTPWIGFDGINYRAAG